MNKDKVLKYIGIITLVFISSIILYSFNNGVTDILAFQKVNSVISYKTYDFAGEIVPIEDPDVYERLDRELTTNSYWQSNTLKVLKRSEKYFAIIEPILEEYNIPNDFKYLAVAESALTNAVSPAGARGIWQFMKTTGKGYDLYISSEIDERYHLEKATRAACQYFLESYNQFGNWTAVAAAYNMGRAGYSRRAASQQENNYYNLYLNSETSRYVFRIIAFKEVMSNPRKYGFIYSSSDAYPSVAVESKYMPVPTYDLAQWAKNNGISYKMLRYLNPWIRDNKITKYRDSEIKVFVPL